LPPNWCGDESNRRPNNSYSIRHYKKIMSMTVSTARKARLHLFRRTGSKLVVRYPCRELGRRLSTDGGNSIWLANQERTWLWDRSNLIFPRRGTVAGPRFRRFIRGEHITSRTRLPFPVHDASTHIHSQLTFTLRRHQTPRVPFSHTYSRKPGGKQHIFVWHTSFKRPRFVEQNYPT